MIGKCLCGEIEFEIEGTIPNLFQCHCSLCRKQGGVASNAGTIVHESKFSWKSGANKVAYYKKDTGFSSNFCSSCGSPVPNQLGDTNKIWIPAGLLEGDEGQQIVAHIYTKSKAGWDNIPDSGQHFDEMPDIETFYNMLQRPER
ncbi:MAG: GFA family protein [Gammaproteobacteria bacterium]|jgi:hypothetical protein|nr:GFA family protein [Gammaproteobacteria bacterium]